MVSVNQVQSGLTRFMDAEIVSKMSGWQKWVFGVGMGLTMNKTADIVEVLKGNPLIAMLGVITQDNQIDLDALYREFKRQAAQGPATIEIPGIPAITLHEADVDKIYQYITQS